ncbi:hypothetical protein H0H87_012375 [Tephrocybe sp. NHM501043]|nr:hypothetical protein H0H87_012375 [Tephrocybe sp. NHM501043]
MLCRPVTGTAPAREFWGISQSIRYSNGTTILSANSGIVDTGAVPDNNTGLLRITSAQLANLKSLFFTINGVSAKLGLNVLVTYEFTANAQLWPRALNTAIGGTANNIYLIVGDLGTPSGEGFDFVNGYAFLERFYSVFDTANQRIGFATTPFTTATTN